MTRQTSDMITLIEQKFEEFKISILNELKNDFSSFVADQREQFDSYLSDKKAEFVNNTEQALSILALQDHVAKLNKQRETLLVKIDALEQYQRRNSVRLYGVPTVAKETSEMVLKKVFEIVSEAKLPIPENSIERAHRVGLAKKGDDDIETQPIIVKFNNFGHRTSFYNARKNLNIGVSLDLTKEMLSLLTRARERVKTVEEIKFVYADINCRLRVFTVAKKHLAFDSMEDLEEIIGKL